MIETLVKKCFVNVYIQSSIIFGAFAMGVL